MVITNPRLIFTANSFDTLNKNKELINCTNNDYCCGTITHKKHVPLNTLKAYNLLSFAGLLDMFSVESEEDKQQIVDKIAEAIANKEVKNLKVAKKADSEDDFIITFTFKDKQFEIETATSEEPSLGASPATVIDTKYSLTVKDTAGKEEIHFINAEHWQKIWDAAKEVLS